MSAAPADAKSEIDRLTESFFQLFSNRGGATPRLERIFDLFVPEGIIARCGDGTAEITTLQEFITPRRELLTNGTLTEFSEVETSENTRVFGHIANRLSTYQKSGVLRGRPFSSRGMKSFQFVRTPAGWRILSMAWDDEREGFAVNELS